MTTSFSYLARLKQRRSQANKGSKEPEGDRCPNASACAESTESKESPSSQAESGPTPLAAGEEMEKKWEGSPLALPAADVAGAPGVPGADVAGPSPIEIGATGLRPGCPSGTGAERVHRPVPQGHDGARGAPGADFNRRGYPPITLEDIHAYQPRPFGPMETDPDWPGDEFADEDAPGPSPNEFGARGLRPGSPAGTGGGGVPQGHDGAAGARSADFNRRNDGEDEPLPGQAELAALLGVDSLPAWASLVLPDDLPAALAELFASGQVRQVDAQGGLAILPAPDPSPNEIGAGGLRPGSPGGPGGSGVPQGHHGATGARSADFNRRNAAEPDEVCWRCEEEVEFYSPGGRAWCSRCLEGTPDDEWADLVALLPATWHHPRHDPQQLAVFAAAACHLAGRPNYDIDLPWARFVEVLPSAALFAKLGDLLRSPDEWRLREAEAILVQIASSEGMSARLPRQGIRQAVGTIIPPPDEPFAD